MRSEDAFPIPQTAAFLAAVLDASDEAIVSVDQAGMITIWNPAAERLYGPTRAEAVGKPLAELSFPSGLGQVVEKVRQVRETGAGTSGTVAFQTNGRESQLFLTAAPVRNEKGEVVGVVVRARDVSAQKESEKASQETSRRLQLVIENAREYAIFSLDLERRVTSWNSGAEALLGFTHDEIVGQTADVIFTPEDREKGIPAREALIALAEGRSADERWHMRKDGTRIWGSGAMMAMLNDSGTPVGLVKIFRDRTEEVKSREALEKSLLETERARNEAEAAVRMKDHFFALISHELRTPLTPIVMAVETLSRNKDLSPAHQAMLAMIKRNVQIEARFIDDLLDVTRIAHDKLELAFEPLDVHDAIRQAVDVVMPDIHARNQTVTVSLEAGESRLEGDPARLQQIFWNLLKNASKFTPEGGALHIRSRLVTASGKEGARLLVEVDDTGIGFEPAIGEKIFEAFAQGDSSVTRKYGGLGLGLAISKAAVEAHGGTLRAHSDGPGHGAVFSVELPLGERPKG